MNIDEMIRRNYIPNALAKAGLAMMERRIAQNDTHPITRTGLHGWVCR